MKLFLKRNSSPRWYVEVERISHGEWPPRSFSERRLQAEKICQPNDIRYRFFYGNDHVWVAFYKKSDAVFFMLKVSNETKV